MEQDRLFKALLTTFFVEFLDLFFPEVKRNLNRQWEAPQTSYPPRTAIGSGGCVGAAAGVLVAEVEWTGGECPVAFGCFGEASLSGMAVLPQNFLRFCQ